MSPMSEPRPDSRADEVLAIGPRIRVLPIIHGSGDSVIPVVQARSFVERLRAVSRSVVSYIELPGAGHGFDMTDSLPHERRPASAAILEREPLSSASDSHPQR